MDQNILNTAFLIPLAPLLAFVLILALRKWAGLGGAWIGLLAAFYSLVHSLLIAVGIYRGLLLLPQAGLQGQFYEATVTWFSIGNFDFRLGILVDGLSAVMMVVVTLVSFLVQVYSVSYMEGNSRFGRYFSYLSLFTFSMLLLVVANDMLQFFIGWELVGLCSYFLIGFDFEREAASSAGRKAFLTTKLGDLGFFIGLLTLFNYLGTFNIPMLQQNMASVQYPAWVLAAVPLLLFCGAVGKSAQAPLHVWLPDAMEGPTPVSALIHAATMVAAGVYLVARVFFLFEAAPFSLEVVAWIGVITALLSAGMAAVADDIKRVLAFSTISQMGFMMAGLGCGGYSAGMFHLITHASFKALLFLCAGCVIHAVHTNDMWKMGGLKTRMPVTATTYLIGVLAITGFPFLSGFFSKEEILSAALHHNLIIFGLLALTSLLTSFYMFRSWFLTFSDVPRDKERYRKADEASVIMTFPLVVLAFLSLTIGAFLKYDENLSHFIQWAPLLTGPDEKRLVLGASLAAFLLGSIGAYWVYMAKPVKYEMMADQFSALYRLLADQFKFDALYLWIINHLVHPLSRLLARFDDDVLDQRIVDGVGLGGQNLSWLSRLFDDGIVDRLLIDGQGQLISRMGSALRRLQSGLVQSYLFWMAVGLVSLFFWMFKQY
ncbi:MAG: NADH-quinone oxidoreductase subunit L [Elusimicrobia bacterium]|nr:NADH-quinone oxidoreductase subunit L [Candidatus Obscuribacterium magneticum]